MEEPPAEPLHVALRIAYDGSRFAAYARDPTLPTVEDALIRALQDEGLVEGGFRTGSRTDAGVSALENVCRATIVRPHLRGLVPSLQRNLPLGLWVTGAARVDERWNPRHAKRRHYRYDRYRRDEELDRMQAACALFLGRHHMGAFAKLEEGRNPERNIFAFNVQESGEGAWSFHVEGDGFLWNQVRRMVSAVLAVGRREAELSDISIGLATQKAHSSFRLAAAEGLVLERIEYDPAPEWSAEAGRLGPHAITRSYQEACARMRLADHLRELAPWPVADSADS